MNLLKVHSGIKGIVFDKETNEPVAGAVVWVTNMTDPKQSVVIKHPVTSGTYVIKDSRYCFLIAYCY